MAEEMIAMALARRLPPAPCTPCTPVLSAAVSTAVSAALSSQ